MVKRRLFSLSFGCVLSLFSCGLLAAEKSAQSAAPDDSVARPSSALNPAPDSAADEATDDDDGLEADIRAAERIGNKEVVQFGLAFRKGLGSEISVILDDEDDEIIVVKAGYYQAKAYEGFEKLSILGLGVESQFFLNQSLFVGTGVTLSKITATAETTDATSAAKINFDGTLYQGAFGMNAGNRWQFDSLTFGIHWLNLTLPFLTANESSQAKDSSGNRYEIQRLKRNQDMNIAARRIDLGVSVEAGYAF